MTAPVRTLRRRWQAWDTRSSSVASRTTSLRTPHAFASGLVELHSSPLSQCYTMHSHPLHEAEVAARFITTQLTHSTHPSMRVCSFTAAMCNL